MAASTGARTAAGEIGSFARDRLGGEREDGTRARNCPFERRPGVSVGTERRFSKDCAWTRSAEGERLGHGEREMPDNLFLYVSASITLALVIVPLFVPRPRPAEKRR